ncbi:MAG: winged helix-turn-helix domain-containing protein [Candidatus Nitrosocosmicus sp.]|nr:winged helix-turn-helix domain-containing protein [Candidatus Nitrosocosmicus sp.]MDN5868584.1 winged helix-turn-helix domain-containing protein [Candidatus Nitrosocosmicus sp.]
MNSTDSDSTKNNNKDNEKDIHNDNDEKDDRISDAGFNNSKDNNENKKINLNEERKPVDPRFKRLLWSMIVSTRGGINRAKIINFLTESPSNANQLSTQLKMDYKTIIHHLEVLKKNGLVVTENEESYGATYFISPLMEKNYSAFKEIRDKIGKK